MAGVVDEEVESLPTPLPQRVPDIAHEAIEGTGVPRIELERGGLPAHRLDLAHHGLGVLLLRAIREDDVAAPPSETRGGIAAKAPASTGDDRDPVLRESGGGSGGLRRVHGVLLS